LVTNPNIYLVIESGIHGGLSYVAQRHALTNFPKMSDYCPDLPTSHLLYLDCNSLYTTCQTYPLPVGAFCFLMGNLHYPAELHVLYTPIRSRLNTCTSAEMLSDMLRLMQDVVGQTRQPCTKLASNLCDKMCYVLHFRCLQFYLTPDSIWTRFTVSSHSLSKPTCFLPSDSATTDGKCAVESSLYKLIVNAFYVKKVENVCKRANVRSISKATYKHSLVINEDLAMVENFRTKVVLTKPIAIGCAILEFVKLVMYEFYYYCLLPTFGEWLRLFYRHGQLRMPRPE